MNRRRASLLLCGVVLVSVSTLAGLDEVVEKRTLRETTSLAPSQDLIVDNLHGDISVTGHSGSEIRMVAVETVRARDQERLERARREVSLAIRETSEGLVVCADGPFRESGDCTEWADNQWRNPGYEVTYEIELQVPRELSSLRVRTVDGDIDISDVRGDFNIGGVNGGIEMSGVDGSGKAHTVNGPVRVEFVENPAEDSEFRTVNGEIDVTFQDGLSADLSFETMNGDVLSDFEYEALPPRPTTRETRRGKTIFRIEPTTEIRIAAGGPRFTFENINGDILVRRVR
jgi:hypothetical protein